MGWGQASSPPITTTGTCRELYLLGPVWGSGYKEVSAPQSLCPRNPSVGLARSATHGSIPQDRDPVLPEPCLHDLGDKLTEYVWQRCWGVDSL